MSLSIVIRNLSKRYGQTRALDDVSLNIKAGSVHGLIGPNGSGKSTLIRVLAGLQLPDSGAIEFDGQVHDRIAQRYARNAGIELVPQELALVPLVKVWENVLLGDEPNGWQMRKTRGRKMARQVLDELGLDIGVDEDTFTLDPGEQRLLMFARTIHRKARLLIADEPTAGLGEEDSRTVLNALKRLNESGVTVLFVSHHLAEVIELCDAVTSMRDGQVRSHIAKADLTVERLITELTGSAGSERARPATARKNKIILEGRHLAMPPLRQLSFKLHENECLGFAGLLGSGREQVVNVVSGAVRLWGSVRIRGEFVEKPHEVVAHGAGILNGNRRLSIVPDWNVGKHLSLPALQRWSRFGVINPTQERAAVQEALRRFGVKAVLDDDLADLSGGNQQRVLMARWLMCDANILLIDEPCVGVDVAARASLLEAIQTFSRSNSVVMASSDALDLIACCDRVLCLRKGVVVKELVGAEITEDAIVRATMLGGNTAANSSNLSQAIV